MNLLILQPTLNSFEYNLFSCDERKLTIDTKVDGFTGMSAEENEWVNSLVQIKQHCQRTQRKQQIDKIVLTVLFGGDVFAKPVVVDSYVIQKLENLIPQAPLHLPGTLQLINCCDQVFLHKP